MSTASTVISVEKSKAFPAIFFGGLICGILDITAAFVTSRLRGGSNPIRLLQSIASVLLGPTAFQGGLVTASFGLAIHFLIAFTAAIVFYLASRKLKFLIVHPFVTGPLYGIAVF